MKPYYGLEEAQPLLRHRSFSSYHVVLNTQISVVAPVHHVLLSFPYLVIINHFFQHLLADIPSRSRTPKIAPRHDVYCAPHRPTVSSEFPRRTGAASDIPLHDVSTRAMRLVRPYGTTG